MGKRKGKIIAFEGCDGVGKETQSKMLHDYLQKVYGIPSILQSFPRYESLSSKPVSQYLNGELGDLDGMEAAVLYAMDRSVFCRERRVKEELEVGTWFIFDRWVQSNAVHVAAKKKSNAIKEADKIMALEYELFELPQPDVTIYLHLADSLSESLLRARAEKQHETLDIHERDSEYISKTNHIGLRIAKKYGNHIIDCYNYAGVHIDSKENIHKAVTDRVRLELLEYIDPKYSV